MSRHRKTAALVGALVLAGAACGLRHRGDPYAAVESGGRWTNERLGVTLEIPPGWTPTPRAVVDRLVETMNRRIAEQGRLAPQAMQRMHVVFHASNRASKPPGVLQLLAFDLSDLVGAQPGTEWLRRAFERGMPGGCERLGDVRDVDFAGHAAVRMEARCMSYQLDAVSVMQRGSLLQLQAFWATPEDHEALERVLAAVRLAP